MCLGHQMVCLKMLCTHQKPNGFADHYPYEKWLFHWIYTQHFQTNPSNGSHFDRKTAGVRYFLRSFEVSCQVQIFMEGYDL